MSGSSGSRLTGLALLLSCLVSLGACRDPSPGKRDGPPNVVLIMVDTLRADKLSSYGFPRETSPELDQLAAEGVRFERVVAQSPWTRPSVASMLTSLYPRTLGLYSEEEDILADRFQTLAEVLKQHGYTTSGWTANPNLNAVFNFNQGFDRYSESHVLFNWMEQEEGKVSNRAARLHGASEMFAQVLEMAAASDEGPHYVQLNIMEMHEYYKPPSRSLLRPEFRSLYPDESFPRYLQSLRQVSRDVGEFVESLLALPGWGDTLFVIVSDHGEGLGDHPDVWRAHRHGRQLYETLIMVPLILYHRGGDLPARTIRQRVRLLDLLPTLLDYLGLPTPEEAQGVSLLPLLMGAETELPEYFVVETQFRKTDKIGVYSPEWKYLDHRDYDTLARDRGGEGVNRYELQAIGSIENGKHTDRLAEHPEAAEPLRQYLAQWEARYPKVEPTRGDRALTPEELEQLRALGYLQ